MSGANNENSWKSYNPVGGCYGAIGGSHNSIGGSHSSMGGSHNSIGGSDGSIGGSHGFMGGSHGSIGGIKGSGPNRIVLSQDQKKELDKQINQQWGQPMVDDLNSKK